MFLCLRCIREKNDILSGAEFKLKRALSPVLLKTQFVLRTKRVL